MILFFQEQWKSSTSGSKRRDRSEIDDEEGGNSEKRRRKGGKRRKKDKHSRSRYEAEDVEAEMMDDQEDLEDENAKMNYGEPAAQINDQDDYAAEENARDPLAAAGLEDSDAEDEVENFLPIFCFHLLTMKNFYVSAWNSSKPNLAVLMHRCAMPRHSMAETSLITVFFAHQNAITFLPAV